VDLLDALHAQAFVCDAQFATRLRALRGRREGSREETELLHAVLRGYRTGCAGWRWETGRGARYRERKDQAEPLLRLFARIEPEWLIDLFPDRIEERDGVEWHRMGERVESVSALVYEGVVLEETRGRAVDPEQGAALLAQKAFETGLHRFVDHEEWAAYRLRRAFAAESCGIPALDEDEVLAALREMCFGLTSFSDLMAACRDGALMAALDTRLDAGARRRFAEMAPARLRLPSGRTAAVRYEAGKPPVVAARLQEFFGMKETPRIGGTTPLLIELLAPNMRPVQTTTDLAGFWERLYPQLRRELSRRYRSTRGRKIR
jgi:ATP-dependent helicase HrpB